MALGLAPVLRVPNGDPYDGNDTRKTVPLTEMVAVPGTPAWLDQQASRTWNMGLLYFVVIGAVIIISGMTVVMSTMLRRSGKLEERAIAATREQADTQKAQNETWREQIRELNVQLANERGQHRQDLADQSKRHGQELEDQAERHRQQLEGINTEHRTEKESMRVRHNEDRDYYARDRDRLLKVIEKFQSGYEAATLQALTTNAPVGLPVPAPFIHSEHTDVRPGPA